MKAITILSSTPDIVFFTADEEFHDQLDRFAKEQGMDQNEQGNVNMDALQMQFLPIFASLEMLELVESPMYSFDTQDGHSFTIRQFDDYLYVGMSDNEPKEFVVMQLTLLRDLLNMLYGPVTALLRPSNASVRMERWRATSRLMSTVAEQRKREQCYLVQAIEKIRISPFVLRICRDAMETALNKNRYGTGKAWGSHAMLLVGTKLLALYSHPSAPSLQSSDLFLLGLFVQDVLDRQETPGLMTEDDPSAKKNETETPEDENSSKETFYPSNGNGDHEDDGASRYFDAQDANTSSSETVTDPPPAAYEELRELRREAVFLHTPSNNYAPYIMHCAEVAPSIALVVLSEGHLGQLSDLMHLALKCLQKIGEIGQAFQRRQRSQEVASEVPQRIHMAVRGGTSQACAYAQINGNYQQLPDMCNGRHAFQRTSMDMYLYYNLVLQAWCLGHELPSGANTENARSGTLIDTASLAAMVLDNSASPENITATWEVYDHDLREFHSDANLKIRCVCGDGCLRNRDGRWAKQSTNGMFYCNGPAQCLCGGCNGRCGPHDGCNCGACKLLDGSHGYGALELALLLEREEALLKANAETDEKSLRRETENLQGILRNICRVGAQVISNNLTDQLMRRMQRLKDTAMSREGTRRIITIMELSEGLAKTLRAKVGEAISVTNQTPNDQEEERITGIQEHVAVVLKDYIDFFHVKIHRNITMTAYLEMYPGLVHFIYVDRTSNTMVAPCLTPGTSGASNKANRSTGQDSDTLKQKVWNMHANAQKRLAQGYTSFTIKAGDFRYSFYLWFESEQGEKLVPKRLLKTTRQALDAQFYRKLTNRLFPELRAGSVRCYELYLIHLARVPFDFTVQQSESLVRELRESTA
eukprot:m.214929 g.214929  ORF g.214929 m.214929 type:complete len:873 (+) comp33181_c1_seq4:274-2892(+)